jgi:hypothetical protein
MIKAEDYFKIDEKEREKRGRKLVSNGKKVYQTLVEPFLDESDFGKFVAIEPDSKSYFIGKTDNEAVDKANENFPDKVFYLVRVGFNAAYSFGGLRVNNQRQSK